MIVNEFFLPVNQKRINTYYFCLMLVLVIPKIETSVAFYFNLILDIVPCVTRIICKILSSVGLKEVQDLLGQCSGRSWSC